MCWKELNGQCCSCAEKEKATQETNAKASVGVQEEVKNSFSFTVILILVPRDGGKEKNRRKKGKKEKKIGKSSRKRYVGDYLKSSSSAVPNSI